jgi:hypothetical protein
MEKILIAAAALAALIGTPALAAESESVALPCNNSIQPSCCFTRSGSVALYCQVSRNDSTAVTTIEVMTPFPDSPAACVNGNC